MSPKLLACLSLFDRRIRLEAFNDPSAVAIQLDLESWRLARNVESWCEQRGAKILYPGHPEYPAPFLFLEAPPLFLSVLGESPWVHRQCLSVVGSREPDRRVVEWMDVQLSRVLETGSLVTVSGGARGVDQRAHAVSLRLGKPTVVFIPSGLARPYPSALDAWIPDILKCGGAIVSEFPPWEPMHKRNFEKRNRLIAGLGRVLFVAEAKRRSGSLMTARLARECSRTITVLPSFPGESCAAGTLDLLFDGAFPIRDAEDLLSLFDLCRISIPGPAQACDRGD